MADRPDDAGLARYELVDRIAVGGMAEVFRATAYGAHGFEKVVAIKRILPALVTNPAFERRFISEAKIAVTLSHANIVQILDFSRFRDSLYIAMEYVDGLDLAALLGHLGRQQRRPPVEAALFIATEIFKGLGFAHDHGVLHRDISPANILLSRSGEVKVADFGIARAGAEVSQARSSKIMGKWPYMSPEQTLGEPLDFRSDLFSAGAVLFETFSGKRLFTGRDPEEVIKKIHEMPIPAVTSVDPSLPADLDRVLGRLLEREPARRPAGAAEVLNALVDISYQNTLPATAMRLADLIRDILPAPAGAAGRDARTSGRLIEDIIHSELTRDGARETVRVTAREHESPDATEALHGAEVPVATNALTFVRAQPGPDGIARWIIEDGGTAATSDEQAGRARRISIGVRRSLAAVLIAGIAIATAGLLVSRWTGTRPATDVHGPPVPGESPPAPEIAPRSIASEPSPAGAEIAIDGGLRLEPSGARIAVTTIPPGAAVLLDGELLGRTPLALGDLRAGPGRRLVLRRDGYQAVAMNVTLEAGETLAVDRALHEVRSEGVINIYVEPWADIYWNGRKIGVAPQQIRLPVGRHRLRLVNDVLAKSRWITVEVPSDRPYRISLDDAAP